MLLTKRALGINLGKNLLFDAPALLGLALWPCKVTKLQCHVMHMGRTTRVGINSKLCRIDGQSGVRGGRLLWG